MTRGVHQMKTGRTMLVASTGGHLEQLTRFVRSRTVSTTDRQWITFPHAQTESLLENESKVLVDYIPSRGFYAALKAIPRINKAIREFNPDTIVSTGAAIAVPAAVNALIMNKKMIYIESVSRFDGPSLTGRILELAPWVTKYTQHHNWSSKKWHRGPTVLGTFTTKRLTNSPVKKVFISLGTISPYTFNRAIEALTTIIPNDVEVRIQHGCTAVRTKKWEKKERISQSEFSENVKWADLVIMHAGVGSVLNVLEMGKVPALLVREAKHREHVDDHQKQIAHALAEKGLCTVVDLENPSWEIVQSISSVKALQQVDSTDPNVNDQ